MRRFTALLHRYGILMTPVFFLGSAWFVSIFAAHSFRVNLPVLGRTFRFGQSDGMVGFSSYSSRATVDFGCGCWLAHYCWRSRRAKKLSLEMAALPQ